MHETWQHKYLLHERLEQPSASMRVGVGGVDMTMCRLCDGPVLPVFKKLVLARHEVSYFECQNCHSLQTEEPYWLDEAYAEANLALVDTGPAWRSVNHQAVIYISARILGFPTTASIVDYGGGTGLLCRLLRDRGFDARVFDAYASNDLARGFEDNGARPDILCSFEVAEHFANPKADMATNFDRRAALLIIGTETYRREGPNWWYISPETGQHVFFYSPEGMQYLAATHGYYYEHVCNVHFFLDRPMTRLEGALLGRSVSPFGLKLVRAYLGYSLTNACAARDATLLKVK